MSHTNYNNNNNNHGGRFFATTLLGGFLAGSAVTLLVTFYYLKKQQQRSSQQDDSEDVPRSISRLRTINPSLFASGNLARDDFFSCLVRELWPHVNVVLCDALTSTVEPMFREILPYPLKTLKFTKCNMGTVPFEFKNIVVHDIRSCSRYDSDSTNFDLDFVWHATDCEIELSTSTNVMGISMGVAAFHLNGRMSILIHPDASSSPVIISAAQFAFLDAPQLDFDFSGLANLADFSIVKTMVLAAVQKSIAAVMVLPNRMLYKMDPSYCTYLDIFQPPRGVARITLLHGSGFQVQKRSLLFRAPDIPDVYCNVTLGSASWRSCTIKDSVSPIWNTSSDSDNATLASSWDFVFSDHSQLVTIRAWDEDRGALDSDDDLGLAQFSLSQVFLAGDETTNVQLMDRKINGKETGASLAMLVEILPFTTKSLSSFQLTAEKDNNNNNRTTRICGMLEIIIVQAFDLPSIASSSFVKVVAGSSAVADAAADFGTMSEFVTGTVVNNTLNPLYDCAFCMPITSDMKLQDAATVTLTLVMNAGKDNDDDDDDVLGTTVVNHDDLLVAKDRTLTERRMIGDQGASLQFRVTLRGLQRLGENDNDDGGDKLATTSSSSTNYEPQVSSSIIITAVSGRGFKIQKRPFRKAEVLPDPYCVIQFGSANSPDSSFRTKTIKNNVRPEWKESKEYPLRQDVIAGKTTVNVDVYDEDKRKLDSKDHHLGKATITVDEIVAAAGTVELELSNKKGAKPTGIFITLSAKVKLNE